MKKEDFTIKAVDKLNHFFWGHWLNIGVLLICVSLVTLTQLAWISIIFSISLGVVIEVYDKVTKKGNVEFMDILATCASGVSIGVLLFILDFLSKHGQ